MWPFATEEEAIMDVLRLARAMTHKSSLAGLDYGGGQGSHHRRPDHRQVGGPLPGSRPIRRHPGRALFHD